MPKIPFWVFILLAVLYFSAIRIDTMDVDASQYAEMSREMAQSKDYIHLYDRGHDYLDKPPFLFWASSTSMRIFGANNFGFKFPSILFALWAIYATYRLAKLLYDEETGRIAALVLGTCQGVFLMTNDIRCDTILMSWVITAVWLIQEWVVNRRLLYLLGGAVCIAFGMMTKGPIAIMVPVFCFISDWALKRQWNMLFKPQYLLAIIVIGILLIPMSIGLYQQYDLHPEKLIDGKSHVSGLRFFFWTQSFGRITGESPWSNGADISFLLQSMLWAFLPWIFLFLPALVLNIANLFKQKFRLQPRQEWVSTGGFILAYLALGSSHYQLPHYIFVAFPLASIMTAKLLVDLINGKYGKLYKFMKPFMITVTALLFVGALLLLTVVFYTGVMGIIFWAEAVIVWIVIAYRKKITGKILWLPAAGIMLVNIFVTNHFYYQLLGYQLGSNLGRFIKEQNISAKKVYCYRMHDPLNALPFYAQRVFTTFDTTTAYLHASSYVKTQIGNEVVLKPERKIDFVLTTDEGVKLLHQNGYDFDTLVHGVHFKVSELTGDFLNSATRSKAISNYYFLHLK